jgi:hypothetical protein
MIYIVQNEGVVVANRKYLCIPFELLKYQMPKY